MTAIVTWCRADDGFRTFGAIVFELFEIFCVRHPRFGKTGRIYLFIHIDSGLKYVECTDIDFLPVKLLSVQFCDHLWTFSQVHSPIRPNGHRVYVTLQGVKWLILWNMGSFHRHSLTDNHTNQILSHPSQPMYDITACWLSVICLLCTNYCLRLSEMICRQQKYHFIKHLHHSGSTECSIQPGCTAFCGQYYNLLHTWDDKYSNSATWWS